MNEPKGIKGEIKILREEIEKLKGEIKFLGIVLHGSGEIKGIFQRLKESEESKIASNEMITKRLADFGEAIDEKFERVFDQFKHQNEFKVKIESYMNLFSSKGFWRFFTALIFAGALLVAWSKGGYFAFLKLIRDLMHGQ